MSRHRDIRNMDFTEDYIGYDDVYGHSAEDDFYISPSHRQYLYNRDSDGVPIPIEYPMEEDIQEEDEIDQEFELSDEDRVKLQSCLDHVQSAFAPMRMSRQEKVKIIISNKFDIEKIMDSILRSESSPSTRRREKDIIPAKPKVPAKGSAPVNINSPGSTPRSGSPRSGRTTPKSGRDSPVCPEIEEAKSKKKEEQYKKERANAKEHLYMIVIGHVDAGKSTMMGHILYDIGQVNQRTMHKYEQESKKIGKQSFMYAWVLDETGEERTRGITMDVGRFQFETNSKLITLLDAPGHKDFIPNMISGAAQADVALLVVDATRGEFETGFDLGGQTREHALLVRSLGVGQLAVAINKLDTVDWSEERFNEIMEKMRPFLKQVGFKEADVIYVPVSGLTGQNLVEKPTEDRLLSWYNGPCLFEVIDRFRPPARPVTKPLRLSIDDIFKSAGSPLCISGKIETGAINVGDKVMICPSRDIATVKAVSLNNILQNVVFAGDQVTASLSGIDMTTVSVGDILCDPRNPVQVTSKFESRVVIFNTKVPLTKGCSVVLHHQSLEESAVLSKLVAQLNKSTGETIKKNPRFLGNSTSAIVQITMSRPIGLELYSDCKELGRVTLRQNGVTIAAGLVTKILE